MKMGLFGVAIGRIPKKTKKRALRAARPSLTLFFIFSGLLLPALADAAPLKKTLEVGGWMPYWRTDQSVADTISNLDNLTAVYPFGYNLGTDGTVYDKMSVADDPWKSFIATAKAKGVRVIPTVMSGDGATLHEILSKSSSRIKLEDDIAAIVKDNNFDGIDIDFEAKLVETKPYFSLFLKGLYQRLGKKWVYCTIESRTPVPDRYYKTTPPPDATDYANDYVAINKYCDRVQIMAYDQGNVDKALAAAQDGPYVPVADPLWVERVVNLAAKTISKKKIILGIPTYGYGFAVTPQAGQGYIYSRLWAFNPKYALDYAAEHNLTPTRNVAGELSFAYIPDMPTSTPTTLGVPSSATAVGPAASQMQPFNIMWWSDSIAIAQKIAIAKKLGIRGVAIFKFDGGEDQLMWNLFK
jgi:spore germination protein YaaH